jgi:hypothetical protein
MRAAPDHLQDLLRVERKHSEHAHGRGSADGATPDLRHGAPLVKETDAACSSRYLPGVVALDDGAAW